MLEQVTRPELRNKRWFNSRPLGWEDLKGKVVMIDFMTYSCINCVRTFPHMKAVWNKYRDKNFLLIGVQAPEFEFEKDPENVAEAIKRYGLDYPIVMDNDFEIWTFFLNQYWPAQYFIDVQGNQRYVHIGEGGEREIEEWIVRLLREAGQDVSLEEVEETRAEAGEVTPEIYAGAARNSGLGNGAVCLPNGCHQYINRVYKHYPEVLYLNGQWAQEQEYLEHEDDQEAYIYLIYHGKEVNVVMSSSSPADVEVLVNDQPLSLMEAGRDIVFEDSHSHVRVDRDDMYNLVQMERRGQHEIKLVSRSKGLRVYAFTFG